MSCRLSESMKKGELIIVLSMVVFASAASTGLAHDVRLAYLEVVEGESGRLDVTWKVPITGGVLLAIEPVFPEEYKQASPRSRIKMANAVIERWSMAADGVELAGRQVSIRGLDSTASDVLVRMKLRDGRVHRVVLRPSGASTVVPEAEKANGSSDVAMGVLLSVDKLRFLVLCCGGLVLSLFAAVRKRGVVLCLAAVLAGSAAGYSVGTVARGGQLLSDGIPSSEQSTRILHGLLLNTYRSCGYRDEDVVYDQLARSVTGDLLSTVYLQNRDALRIDEAEGAKSIIDRVDVRSVEAVERLEDGALSVVANWDVYGSVRHWGHTHYRCNSYKAQLTIVPAEDYWKISALEVLDEERVI